ncbi:MAG TPA: PIG-L family deacetylase [Dokdonella sp.]|uniref:PIG-L deacetylase family protein n=1 Tax=Dokdonella sp. TaxID=2291710 RepID=UPI002BDCA958|nr:PIG-L family deacetylase [Dokdonella sp.]HUD40640.1 PIG-L family deacetylase [Dokdonella sp.]
MTAALASAGRVPAFAAGDRVLVVAVHPDDETLASAGLIQAALAAGAAVRVVFVTDGDDNPWPQRWLERRWRIDAAARRRWGARRRDEARAALATLGVEAGAAQFLGLPDQGLTAALVAGDALERALQAAIDAFDPTWIAGPSRADRHPDHSAVAVALDRIGRLGGLAAARRLAAVVHGAIDTVDVALALDAAALRRKREALAAHRTQLALSRGRLERMAAAVERYTSEAKPSSSGLLTLPFPPHRRRLARHALLIVAEGEGGAVERRRLDLSPHRRPDTESALPFGWRLTIEPRTLTLRPGTDSGPLYAKIDRLGPRWIVFDADGWHRWLPR